MRVQTVASFETRDRQVEVGSSGRQAASYLSSCVVRLASCVVRRAALRDKEI